MLSNPSKRVTIYGVAGIIGKSFSKQFTKHYIENGFHVTGIYPLNSNIFGKDEFLSSYIIDRTYNQVTDPASAPSVSMDNNEEGISAGFLKMSPEILRAFPKDGPRKTGRRKQGSSRILTQTPEKTEIANQRATKGRRK